MKRLAIFVLLGPLIGMLSVAPPGYTIGIRVTGLLDLMVWTYIGGAGPALVAGLADGFFSRRLTPLYRALATGFVGFAASAILIAVAFGPRLALFGAVGVLPGIVCSWLARQYK